MFRDKLIDSIKTMNITAWLDGNCTSTKKNNQQRWSVTSLFVQG